MLEEKDKQCVNQIAESQSLLLTNVHGSDILTILRIADICHSIQVTKKVKNCDCSLEQKRIRTYAPFGVSIFITCNFIVTPVCTRFVFSMTPPSLETHAED